MILYHIPLLMVLAFLGLTLVVGLSVIQKATTFREYAVGNKQFHTTTLVVTVLATAFGGGALMHGMPKVYAIGMHYIVSFFTISICFWINSLLGLRMGPFMEHLSIAETIGNVYGKYPRTIVAILGICLSIGVVAVQINVMSATIGICIDSIDPRTVTILTTLILIAYAMLGGVRAITITDILQFVTFMIIIILLIKFLFIKTGKSFLEIILLLKKQEKFQFSNLYQFDRQLLELVVSGLWSTFLLTPSIIQKVYMSSGPIQAYKVFLRATFSSVIILGCIVSIGLFVFVRNPTLSATEIWPYILANMSPAYKGCVVVGLLGMAMSTADSNLHTAAIMVGHDMVKSIRGVKIGSYIHQIRLAKLTVLVTGLLAMIVTVYYPDPTKLTGFVARCAVGLFTTTVAPPFILAVFGFRGSARTALIGMAIGILAYFAWDHKQWTILEMHSGFFPLICNSLAMMAAHYLLPQPAGKGWIGHNDQQKRMQQLIRAFKKYKKI